MARKRLPKLTPLEARVMDCVWDLREATVREVKDRLDQHRAAGL